MPLDVSWLLPGAVGLKKSAIFCGEARFLCHGHWILASKQLEVENNGNEAVDERDTDLPLLSGTVRSVGRSSEIQRKE